LQLFAGANVLPMSSLTDKWCNDFKAYLQNTTSIKATQKKLSANTASIYYSIFKSALRQAYKEDYLPKDLAIRIGHIKKVEVRKEFLTVAELNTLIKTDCSKPIVKAAALFSALTGLRFSDIQKMTWSEIEHIEGKGYYLKFTQQKTKGVVTKPISEQAYRILGTPRNPNDKVFEGLKERPSNNVAISVWIAYAGIKKHITFHCFRHTYASLLSDANVPVALISDMLGHKDLSTTQKYIHTLDSAKREAAEKIQLDF
jgi:integrase